MRFRPACWAGVHRVAVTGTAFGCGMRREQAQAAVPNNTTLRRNGSMRFLRFTQRALQDCHHPRRCAVLLSCARYRWHPHALTAPADRSHLGRVGAMRLD